MTTNFGILCTLALTLGAGHTAAGPDHYVPFIALSNARNWSQRKTLLITLLCGLGHVLSSVVIGFVGLGIRKSVDSLEIIEGMRGDVAAWLLTTGGIIYLLWAVYALLKKKQQHHHNNGNDHHSKKSLTVWSLFIIFVFGPCEPLIPLLMFPAATINLWSVVIITAIFGVATLAVMLTFVFIGTYSNSILKKFDFHRYSHIIAGGLITFCGIAVLSGL